MNKFFKIGLLGLFLLSNSTPLFAQSLSDNWQIEINDKDGMIGQPTKYVYNSKNSIIRSTLTKDGKSLRVGPAQGGIEQFSFGVNTTKNAIRQGFYGKNDARIVLSNSMLKRVCRGQDSIDSIDIKALSKRSSSGVLDSLEKFYVSGSLTCLNLPSKSLDFSFSNNWQGETVTTLNFTPVRRGITQNSDTYTVSLPVEHRVDAMDLLFSRRIRPNTGLVISSVSTQLSGPSDFGFVSQATSIPLRDAKTSRGQSALAYNVKSGGPIFTPRGNKLDITVFKKGNRIAPLLEVKLNVKPAYRSWTNQNNEFDVNGDGIVSTIDALNVINYLNRVRGNSLLPEFHPADDNYVDVNGDGLVTATDGLLVLNFISQGG